MSNDLRAVLNRNKDRYISFLCKMVACDTQVVGHGIEGGNEANGQVLIEQILRDLGARIERNPLREETICRSIEEYGEGNPGHNYENRYNLVATVKGEQAGRSILFDGHMDTMPIADPKSWRIDPRQPEIIEGRLYGRGACDCKGGLVGAIMALQLLADAGMKPPGDVVILSVADEEGGGNGTIEAMMDGYRADVAIMTEPTGNRIQIAHPGFVLMEIKVRGKSLHSAEKWRGVNAIEKGLKIIEAMKETEYRWMTTYRNPLVPFHPTLNVGVISGGRESSTVPEECTIKVCVHFPPRVMDMDLVEKELREGIAECVAGEPWLRENPPEMYVYQRGGACQIDTDDPFVLEIKDLLEESMGYAPVIEGSTYATDTRTLQNIGKMPAITIGPGYNEQAHSTDEYVDIGEFLEYILICANIMLNWGKKKI